MYVACPKILGKELERMLMGAMVLGIGHEDADERLRGHPSQR